MDNLKHALREAEAKFRADREAQRMHPVSALIERECLAHRLAALDPTFQSPVWYLSHLRFIRVTRGRGPHSVLEVVAQAYNAKGPIVNNRITFSMGLHHSCFGYTDAKGLVACTLVDTHPHGPGDEHKDEAETVVASLQGSMSDALVEWPTTATRKLATRSGHAEHPMHPR